MGLGLREILILVLIIVVVFGARKIPQILGDFGKGIKSFRKGLSDSDDAAANPAPEPPRQISPAPPADAAKSQGVRQTEP